MKKVKDNERYSIITPKMTNCFVCGASPCHCHEVFGGAFREKSKQYGMTVSLCPAHHNLSSAGIHFNSDLDLKVKQLAEKKWIEEYCKDKTEAEAIKEFIKTFGRNYLD